LVKWLKRRNERFVIWLALTPALSPEEREEKSSGFGYSTIKTPFAAHWFFEGKNGRTS
jgi:hypothetical protein